MQRTDEVVYDVRCSGGRVSACWPAKVDGPPASGRRRPIPDLLAIRFRDFKHASRTHVALRFRNVTNIQGVPRLATK